MQNMQTINAEQRLKARDAKNMKTTPCRATYPESLVPLYKPSNGLRAAIAAGTNPNKVRVNRLVDFTTSHALQGTFFTCRFKPPNQRWPREGFRSASASAALMTCPLSISWSAWTRCSEGRLAVEADVEAVNCTIGDVTRPSKSWLTRNKSSSELCKPSIWPSIPSDSEFSELALLSEDPRSVAAPFRGPLTSTSSARASISRE
jgi:hypothetical protein